ncbi:MAG TPA: hypothetical protein VGL38_13720 [bacterium]|jgi:hypothetical protein
MPLWLVATIVFFLNIPFGVWRSKVRKFSLQWILAIHLPVPMIIALRMYSGLGFQLYTFPIMIGAFFFGQFAGSRSSILLSQRTHP